MDCLLVHVPKLLEHSEYVGWYSRINFLSMGIFSIAEELDRAGLACRIVHVGVEKQLDPHFSLVSYVRAAGARVVAFALHWHPQTYDTIEAARAVKAALPDVRIVLGGLTATCFAKDLLEAYPFVDAVIRGEAERPLPAYVAAVRAGAPPVDVPNLTWRDGGVVREQPLTFVTSSEDMNGWRFDAWHLLEHRETYLKQNWRNSWEPEFKELMETREPTLFGAALGRGCMGTCTWCAGSFGPMKLMTGRRRTAWRSADRIADTVRKVREYGVRRIYTCFDPLPNRMREVLELFDELGRMTPKVALDFETFGLPGDELVDAFARNLAPDSQLILSPEAADEALRDKHRAFPFTNAELDHTLARMHDRGVRTALYFIIGLPGDTLETIARTRDFQLDLKRRFPNVRHVFTWPLEMEPGSPWFVHPERYGLTTRRRTIQDFHAAHGRPEFTLGYDLATLTEAEILDVYDRMFLPAGLDREVLRAHRRQHPRDHRVVRQL